MRRPVFFSRILGSTFGAGTTASGRPRRLTPLSGPSTRLRPAGRRWITPACFVHIAAWRHSGRSIPLFFAGRAAFSEQLLSFVLGKDLVAVVGPSGSGKSSVVQAGLVPLLRRKRPPAKTWDAVTFTPSSDPFYRLAAALMPLLEPNLSETDRLSESQKLGERLTHGEARVDAVIDRIIEKSNGTSRLLVVADQFEEIFTATPEPSRRPFAQMLLQAVGRAPFTLLLTVRADSYSQIINLDRGFSDRIASAQVNIGALAADELRESIGGPARLVGLEFEPGLVERLLTDVGNEPGSLPLLEFALTEIWHRREGPRLTNHAYNEIRGIAGALARRAEAEFARFSPDEKTAARRLFSRLVRVARPDEGAEDTRQRIELQANDAKTVSVAQAFALPDVRLLVAGRDEQTGGQIVEVAHEALIRNWERLRGWLNEDREFLLWRQRVEIQVEEWARAGQDVSYLLRGAPLSEAERWLAKRPEDLAEGDERAYINASLAWRNAESQKSRRIKRLILASGAVAVLAIVCSWMYTYQAFRAADANYRLTVNAAASFSKLVKEHLMPDSPERPTSLLAKDLLRDPLEILGKIQAKRESPETALSRLQLYELLWNNFVTLGYSAEAAKAAKEELETAQQREKSDPSNPEWLWFMVHANQNLGDGLLVSNDVASAMPYFRHAVDFAALLSSEHGGIASSNELAHAHERLGDAYRDLGKFSEALAEFRLFVHFAAKPRDSSGAISWERKFAIVHGKIGDMLAMEGDLLGAENEYVVDLQISERLDKQVFPRNLDLFRGVGVAHERLGFARRKQGKGRLSDAAKDYGLELEIASELVRKDPENYTWRRDQALAYEGLGDVSFDNSNYSGALKRYREYRDAMEIMFKRTPTNAWRKREVAVAHQRLGETWLGLNQREDASNEFQLCLSASDGATTAVDIRNPEPRNVRASCQEQLKKLGHAPLEAPKPGR